MKSKKDWAKYHAEQGWYVFRLIANGKTPKKKGWQMEATRDPAEIEKLWSGNNADCNIGGFTSKLFDDEAAIVVDVDMKGDRDGDASIIELVNAGYEFPDTLIQYTPTGGRHIVYRAPWAVKQGAAVLGRGLDIRSRGGFIVMAGSTVPTGDYVTDMDEIADAPQWLFAKLSAAPDYEARKRLHDVQIDPEVARERGSKFLVERAHVPEEGQRNDTAFKVACELKDLGCDENVTLDLIENEWNVELDEPLEEEELVAVVMSAFKHGQNEMGSKAPETMFVPREKKEIVEDDASETCEIDTEICHPFLELNKEFALVISGGSHHILYETTDQDDNQIVQHIQEPSFHKMRAHLTMGEGDGKRVPITKAWLTDARARRYQGLVYEPERNIDPRYYNLWKGFPVKRLATTDHPTFAEQKSFDAWKEHVLKNICNGNQEHYNWVIAWCADMIQRPWRKPLTSIVLQGEKGVGKNIFVEALCELMAPHYMIVDDPRYLNSNFNSHMESLSLMAVDEASWGGDVSHEGHLKGLITGKAHNIERKGKEPYKIKNILRLIFMSNNRWVVPASFDERRFFVTTVGKGNKKDRKFFSTIVDEDNKMIGIRLLMTYLLDFDLTGYDVDVAPDTEGLLGQKIASLDPMEQWWFDCISEATLTGSLAKGVDFSKINCDTFNRAFGDYVRSRHIRSRLPTADVIKNILSNIAPSITRTKIGNEFFYISDGLEVLRRDWELYIGSTIKWEPLDKGELECLK